MRTILKDLVKKLKKQEAIDQSDLKNISRDDQLVF
jgi:hypothetical protein